MLVSHTKHTHTSISTRSKVVYSVSLYYLYTFEDRGGVEDGDATRGGELTQRRLQQEQRHPQQEHHYQVRQEEGTCHKELT